MPADRLLPHEFGPVANVSGCRHCRRMEHMLNPRPGDECPARLRTALDEARALARDFESGSAVEAHEADKARAEARALRAEIERLRALVRELTTEQAPRGPAACAAPVTDAAGRQCGCPLPPGHDGDHATAIGAP